MMKLILLKGTKLGVDIGPGTVEKSHYGVDFYGELHSSEFITGGRLSQDIGFTSGSLKNDTVTWLKFSIDDKLVFIPKKVIRSSTSWDSIYRVGAVYGDDTFGSAPSSVNRIQDSRVTINGYDFIVRLPKGNSVDPISYSSTSVVTNLAETNGSEWNRLIYPIVDGTFRSYSSAELDFTNNQSQSWCQEATSNRSLRVIRGANSAYDLHVRTPQSDMYTSTYRAWRPILEFVG